MRNFIFAMIGFVVGGLAGGFATYKYMERKMEERIDAEAAAMRERYREYFASKIERRNEKKTYLKAKVDAAEDKGSIVAKIVENYEKKYNLDGETNEEDVYNGDDEYETGENIGRVELLTDDVDFHEEPFVIDESQLSEYVTYDVVCLIYFADGVLTDDWEMPVEDPVFTVGTEYERILQTEDIMYVRNDRLRCYFEIAKDIRTFAGLKGGGEDD